MSYTGFSASSIYFSGTFGTSSIAEPLTMVMWIKLTAAQWADTSQDYCFSLCPGAPTAVNTFMLGTTQGTADEVWCSSVDGGGSARVPQVNPGNSSWTDGDYDDIWVPVIGVIPDADNSTVYIENSSISNTQGPLTRTVTLGSTPDVVVGLSGNLTSPSPGLIAEFAIFDKVLTTAEVDTLQTGIGQGIPPILAAPQNCIGYWPLKDNQSSHVDQAYRGTGAPALAATGSPTYSSDHPIMSALPNVRCILTERNGTRRQSLTSLKWAWFDETDPQNFNAPVNVGTIETTDANGLIEVDIPGTTLTQGQEGCLAVMSSDNVDMGLYKLMVL